jgi:methyltransferase (TIGR00027 family)
MPDKGAEVPDSTAVRVALWRALHLEVDPPPHVFEDEVGLRLAAPDPEWRRRPDMDPPSTRRARASIVARARFMEDLAVEQASHGVDQCVILGAGLDTFAQRRPEIAGRMRVFEVDQPGPQAWKRRRLLHLGLEIPPWLHFVPVDLEGGQSWWKALAASGFRADRPALAVAAGLMMYLSQEANGSLLRQMAEMAPGSALAATFMLPLESLEPEERPMRQATERHARSAGTPFLSFFTGEEVAALALEAGFREARAVSSANLAARYFKDRPDSLRPSSSEELLVASV